MRKFNFIIFVLVLCCMSSLFVSCGTTGSNVAQDGGYNDVQTGVNETSADSNSKGNEPIELTAENFEEYFSVYISEPEMSKEGPYMGGFYDYSALWRIQIKPRYSFKCEAFTVTLKSGYLMNKKVVENDISDPVIDQIVLNFTPDGNCDWEETFTENFTVGPIDIDEKIEIVEKKPEKVEGIDEDWVSGLYHKNEYFIESISGKVYMN